MNFFIFLGLGVEISDMRLCDRADARNDSGSHTPLLYHLRQAADNIDALLQAPLVNISFSLYSLNICPPLSFALSIR